MQYLRQRLECKAGLEIFFAADFAVPQTRLRRAFYARGGALTTPGRAG
jgi:hypothetical protein